MKTRITGAAIALSLLTTPALAANQAPTPVIAHTVESDNYVTTIDAKIVQYEHSATIICDDGDTERVCGYVRPDNDARGLDADRQYILTVPPIEQIFVDGNE